MKNKIVSILLTLVTVCASVAIVYFAAKYDATNIEAFESFLSFSLYSVYSIMAIAFISLVGFAVWSVVNNFKESKPALLGVAVLLIVLVLGYVISPSTNTIIEQKFAVNPGLSKVIGGGLLATYIFMFGALLAAIWSTVSSRFK